MAAEPKNEKQVREVLLLAQISCLALGIGLITWGLAPMIVQRLASRMAPDFESFAISSLTLLLGIIFFALSLLISRRVAWALRTAFYISLFLLAGTLSLYLMNGARYLSVFPTLLTAGTAGITWITLATWRPGEQAADAETTPAEQATPAAAPGNEPAAANVES